MCDSISSFLLILGDGHGDVSLQEIGFVIVINVFPPKAQFLDNYIANMTRETDCPPPTYLFGCVQSLPTVTSCSDVLVSRVDRDRDGLVEVDLVCGDGDVHVHGGEDTGSDSPVSLTVREIR